MTVMAGLFLLYVIGQYLASVTGLPIDFQFQQMTAANEKHAKPRNPLGTRSMWNYQGDAEPFYLLDHPAEGNGGI